MAETLEHGGWCDALCREAKLPPTQCCGSCHNEWDDDYGQPSEREWMGKRYDVCCVVATDFDVAHPRIRVEESGRQCGKTDLLAATPPTAAPPEKPV